MSPKFLSIPGAFGLTASFVFYSGLAAGQNDRTGIPNFSTYDYGWSKEGTGFLPPASGPGPITYDKAHPILTTAPDNRGVAVTAPLHVADLSNPIFKPWVVERMKKDNDEIIAGKIRYNPRSYCRPTGVPEFLIYGGLEPLYFAQSAKETLIINQADTQVRHVYMNVAHSKNPKPSFYGESVGRYEGDELVVDTIGLTEGTSLDSYGTPHSAQLHVVERYRVIDQAKTLQVRFTVDDPGAFNAAWSAVARFHRSPAFLPLTEEPCAENNGEHPGMSYQIPTATPADF